MTQEQKRAYWRDYYKRNKESALVRQQRHYLSHKSQKITYIRNYRRCLQGGRFQETLRARYRIDLEIYNGMIMFQGGKCALCLKELRFANRGMHVDHDHETGKVRAILCGSCNRAIAGTEDVARLISHIKYIYAYKPDAADDVYSIIGRAIEKFLSTRGGAIKCGS